MANLRAEIRTVLTRIPIDFGGGCPLSKAFVMAELIRSQRLQTTVDIGVYRGRSFFPQALAHKLHTGGIVYGIDPYDIQAARETDTPLRDRVEQWLAEQDFGRICQDVEKLRDELGLAQYGAIIRQTSEQAIRYFEERAIRLDMIHVDGNHDTQFVLKDLDLYLPRLRPHGFVILDDISWESVRPAYARLAGEMTLVYETQRLPDDYAVFWRGGAPGQVARLRRRLRAAKRASQTDTTRPLLLRVRRRVARLFSDFRRNFRDARPPDA